MRRLSCVALAGLMTIAAGCTIQADESGNLEIRSAFSQARSASEFRWQGQVSPGLSVEVKGVNGTVDASPSATGQVEVVADRTGRRNDPSEVTIEVVEHAKGLTICAVYPSPDDTPNECAPGSAGRMKTRNNDVRVDFTVRVPAGLRFVGRTVNGGVKANDLGGHVSLHTVNGNINFSTSGYGDASTVNGSIRGAFGSADWAESLAFETVNGGITLELPEAVNAEVRAQTVNGSISTDFPLTVSGRFSNRRLSGTIGDGGRLIELETVNGSIALRQR